MLKVNDTKEIETQMESFFEQNTQVVNAYRKGIITYTEYLDKLVEIREQAKNDLFHTVLANCG